MDIWLTVSEKIKLMKELERAYSRGTLDEGAYPILCGLNAIPGVASTQCCMGHKDIGHESDGYLSVRVTQTISDILEDKIIPMLLRDEYILSIYKTWELSIDNDTKSRYIFRFKVGEMFKLVNTLIKDLS